MEFFTDSATLLRFLVMPVISSQIIVSVMIYFILVRRQISREYGFYLLFLACLAYFLFGRSLQHFSAPEISIWLLCSRVFLLFSLGMPALVIGASLHAGIKRSVYLLYPPWLVGALLGFLYVYFMGVFQGAFEPLALTAQLLPKQHQYVAHQVQIWAGFSLLLLPCLLLLIKVQSSPRQTHLSLFLVGALSFALLFFLGSARYIDYWLYYTGSVVCALCWAYAVFQNIRNIKGKAALLKDELFFQIKSSSAEKTEEIRELLSKLEKTSDGDLELYKMRVRDILNRLTDSSIEAGGDSSSLMLRHQEKNQAIDSSRDMAELSRLVAEEAAEYSDLLSQSTDLRIKKQVEQAKTYIFEHAHQAIDIETIASQVGLSKGHLMRVFKAQVGQTLNQYLAQVRIEKAKHLLKSYSVTETAFAVGFNNSNYFNTVFKKQVGCTPGQYKQNLAGN